MTRGWGIKRLSADAGIGKRRRGEEETRRRGEEETGRRGNGEKWRVARNDA
jgi:hypothetical protein